MFHITTAPKAPGISTASHRAAILCLTVFVAGLAGKLATLRKFASDIPLWDQWSAEGLKLIKPYLTGGIAAVPWFSNHNEHRIVLSRIWALAAFALNGQWDPALLASLNAILHAAFGAERIDADMVLSSRILVYDIRK